jgi:hypothetical protein
MLCGELLPLLLSHVLPAFVYRWKRESSGGSHLRSTDEPNLRVQDGIKRHWLCAGCEERFSKDERAFANKIFYPYLSDPAAELPYGPWLLRFCTSVSWRVLRYAFEEDRFEDWDRDAVSDCERAESVWREVLLGARPHPGDLRQHLLPFDIIEQGAADAAPNINRYLTRAIQIDLCRGSKSVFTFAKLGRFGIFGMIRPDTHPWIGTKVHAKEGSIRPRRYQVPGPLWKYLNDKARDSAAALDAVSDKQRAKIDQAFQQNVDAFVGTVSGTGGPHQQVGP